MSGMKCYRTGVCIMSVTNIEAMRKWKKIPKDIRQQLINNVFCSKCLATTIVDYTLHEEEEGISLQGKCKTCGQDVARLVEDAWMED